MASEEPPFKSRKIKIQRNYRKVTDEIDIPVTPIVIQPQDDSLAPHLVSGVEQENKKKEISEIQKNGNQKVNNKGDTDTKTNDKKAKHKSNKHSNHNDAHASDVESDKTGKRHKKHKKKEHKHSKDKDREKERQSASMDRKEKGGDSDKDSKHKHKKKSKKKDKEKCKDTDSKKHIKTKIKVSYDSDAWDSEFEEKEKLKKFEKTLQKKKDSLSWYQIDENELSRIEQGLHLFEKRKATDVAASDQPEKKAKTNHQDATGEKCRNTSEKEVALPASAPSSADIPLPPEPKAVSAIQPAHNAPIATDNSVESIALPPTTKGLKKETAKDVFEKPDDSSKNSAPKKTVGLKFGLKLSDSSRALISSGLKMDDEKKRNLEEGELSESEDSKSQAPSNNDISTDASDLTNSEREIAPSSSSKKKKVPTATLR